MSVSKETKKAEAVSRMKSIGIFSETIRQFEEEDSNSTQSTQTLYLTADFR